MCPVSIVDKLTEPPTPVASENPSTRAFEEFISFSTANIQNIRQMVSATVPITGGVLSICPPKTNSNTMRLFDPNNDKNLQDTTQHFTVSAYVISRSATNLLIVSSLRHLPTSHENYSYSTSPD